MKNQNSTKQIKKKKKLIRPIILLISLLLLIISSIYTLKTVILSESTTTINSYARNKGMSIVHYTALWAIYQAFSASRGIRKPVPGHRGAQGRA